MKVAAAKARHLSKIKALEDLVLCTDQPPTYQAVVRALSEISYEPHSAFPDKIFPPYSADHLAAKNVYSIVSQELVDAISYELSVRGLSDASIIEVCAGRGLLSHHLRQKGLDIVATDDYSEDMARLESVERFNHKEALEKYRPEVVVVFWPAYSPLIGIDILSFQSVNFFLSVEESWACDNLKGRQPPGFSSSRLPSVEKSLICYLDTFSPGESGGPIEEVKYSGAILFQRLSLTSIASSPKSW